MVKSQFLLLDHLGIDKVLCVYVCVCVCTCAVCVLSVLTLDRVCSSIPPSAAPWEECRVSALLHSTRREWGGERQDPGMVFQLW